MQENSYQVHKENFHSKTASTRRSQLVSQNDGEDAYVWLPHAAGRGIGERRRAESDKRKPKHKHRKENDGKFIWFEEQEGQKNNCEKINGFSTLSFPIFQIRRPFQSKSENNDPVRRIRISSKLLLHLFPPLQIIQNHWGTLEISLATSEGKKPSTFPSSDQNWYFFHPFTTIVSLFSPRWWTSPPSQKELDQSRTLNQC